MRVARFIAILLLLVVLAGLAAAAWVLSKPGPQYLQGEVEATKVNVSAKVPGRVEEMYFDEGQSVKKGDIIATLDRPQLEAKKQQAEAARSAASAQSEKAENGAREEQIRMAQSQWLQAQAGADFAQKSFERVERLFEDGVVPMQKRDEVQAQRDMARKLEAAAKAQYDMAVNGTRYEDKEAAAALVDQASGAVSEVDSLIEEAQVRAPIDGEVVEHIVNLGELASAGMPIVTLIDLTDVWATFNVREDNLGGLKMGEHLQATVPALNGQTVEVEVVYIAPLGDFATWRSTSASGGFDLRTFEVRMRPLSPVDGLRPGMSMLILWDRVPPKDNLEPLRRLMPWAI